MSRSGGTQLYCPTCKDIRTCKVAEYHDAKDYTGDYGQRWQRTDHPDICWFRRVRHCLVCEERFTTAEITEGLLAELVILRDRVESFRKTIDTHKAAAKSASNALEQLTTALDAIGGSKPDKTGV